jgi:hypothetical protein
MDHDVTLIKHIESLLAEKDKRDEQRFQAQSLSITMALAAAEKAVTKAEMATEKRFDSVNEFRNTLSDQAKTLLSRTEFEASRDSLAEKVSDLSSRMDRNDGRSGGYGSSWLVIIGAIGLVQMIVLIYFALQK